MQFLSEKTESCMTKLGGESKCFLRGFRTFFHMVECLERRNVCAASLLGFTLVVAVSGLIGFPVGGLAVEPGFHGGKTVLQSFLEAGAVFVPRQRLAHQHIHKEWHGNEASASHGTAQPVEVNRDDRHGRCQTSDFIFGFL